MTSFGKFMPPNKSDVESGFRESVDGEGEVEVDRVITETTGSYPRYEEDKFLDFLKLEITSKNTKGRIKPDSPAYPPDTIIKAAIKSFQKMIWEIFLVEVRIK